MASASKRPSPVQGPGSSTSPGLASGVLRGFTAVYRFLASLKLAVITLSSLAAVLSYATFFEKWYGTAAVQEWIYQSKGFAILLAFLGANILCAALIRYPWKKRQTGFVVTHAGLLILLGGSWYSVMTSDSGTVAALEGEVKDEIVRSDYPVVRIKQVDPKDPNSTLREWELPFRPGAFAWGPGEARPRPALTSLLGPLGGKPDPNPREVLTGPKDPFTFVARSHIPASVPTVAHQKAPMGQGVPMAKVVPTFKPPGMPKGREVFGDEEAWFVADRRFYKAVKTESEITGAMPATFAFFYDDRPGFAEEFLNPPTDVGELGVAHFRYVDKDGKDRTHDLKLDGKTGTTFTLPDSDLKVKFLDVVAFPADEAGLTQTLGESSVPIAEFEIAKGEGAPVKHFALASLPMFPNVIPGQGGRGETPKALAQVSYYLPPKLDPKGNGKFGLVEVLGIPDGSLYYRVFGRSASGKPMGEVRSKGTVAKGKSIVAFGGNANMPMTIEFRVDDFLPSGEEKPICEPIALPVGQMGNGIAASLVEMTVPDEHDPAKTTTKEFYIRRSATTEPVWQTVTFPEATYRIAYDVERGPLGFELKMVDFQRGFDPGTEAASKFSSDVLLTDKSQGVKERPVHIAMNEPLTHRGYTFYQSSFIREEDPKTRRETGRVISVFQVGSNPGWGVMYLGCLTVVAGAFLQFYMRAGLFTDGGKREREQAQAKAMKAPGANGHAHGGDGTVAAMAGAVPRRRAADDDTL